MTHELAGTLQKAVRVWQGGAVEETHVYMRGEYVDVAEGRVSQTSHRTAVMKNFPDFVSTLPHDLKPLVCERSQLTRMLFHPRIDGRIALDRPVEPQEFLSHRRALALHRNLHAVQRQQRMMNHGAKFISALGQTAHLRRKGSGL